MAITSSTKATPDTRHKICSTCHIDKSFDDFYYSPNRRDKRNAKCRECRKREDKIYRIGRSIRKKRGMKVRHIQKRDIPCRNCERPVIDATIDKSCVLCKECIFEDIKAAYGKEYNNSDKVFFVLR